MIVKDNQGNVVGQIEHLRDANGNTVDTNTMYSGGRPVTQTISVRDNQGHVETRSILGGKLLP
jgi:hypothetical protein